jgi:RNA-directed DNA polymerase
MPAERFDFLGYTFGRWWRVDTGRAYVGHRPSAKAVRQVVRAVHAATSKRWWPLSIQEVVQRLNQLVRGWANYFRLGSKAKTYRCVDGHVRNRLRQWWQGKLQARRGAHVARLTAVYMHDVLGLVRLQP